MRSDEMSLRNMRAVDLVSVALNLCTTAKQNEHEHKEKRQVK